LFVVFNIISHARRLPRDDAQGIPTSELSTLARDTLLFRHIAAIDVGSNGIRFAIASVGPGNTISRVHTARESIRLGEDVFRTGKVQPATVERLLRVFAKFQRVGQKLKVQRVLAVATSAMREASNGKQIVQRIQQQTGLRIRIIGGSEEARLILLAVKQVTTDLPSPSLLLDMGGGSIELTVLRSRGPVASCSLPLGAVRLLKQADELRPGPGQVAALIARHAAVVARFLDRAVGNEQITTCVATGGNVETLGRLRVDLLSESDKGLLLYRDIDQLIGHLDRTTPRQRIERWGLRPDRADVIHPASLVLQMVCLQAGVERVLIPRVGVKDGLLIDTARAPRATRSSVTASASPKPARKSRSVKAR
jgi:exopolyphosphatase / guanosine-5'-triphosphate,3'-diphosphate pyrophosphatase